VYRRDYGPDLLVVGERLPARTLPFTPSRYGRIRVKVQKNLAYIGNLVALWHWYDQVRLSLAGDDADLRLLYRRGRAVLEECVDERIKRLGQIAGYMEDSIHELEQEGEVAAKEIGDQRAFGAGWARMEQDLCAYRDAGRLDGEDFPRFMEGVAHAAADTAGGYLEVIRALTDEARAAGTAWLASILEGVKQVSF
jgi:hypothetical protein